MVCRYERDNPDDLICVDIKPFALTLLGIRWKVHGRKATAPGRSSRERRSLADAPSRGSRRAGYAYLLARVDDRSRLVYSEVPDDESLATTIAFWRCAAAFYASRAIAVREVLTDIGVVYQPTPGRTPLLLRASGSDSLGPPAHKPTAKSNTSSAPWETNGLTARPTKVKNLAAKP